MLLDDAELELQPLAILLDGEARREAMDREARVRAPPRPGGATRAASSAPWRRHRRAEKRGRIGCSVRGRKAQRCAISTVVASASGRSANSAAISARVLK